MLHWSKLPVRGPVRPSVNKPPHNEMDPEKYNERANEAISEGNNSQSNNEGDRLDYGRFTQEVDRRWTIDPNKPEPVASAVLNNPTLSPLIGYNSANPAEAEKTMMDSDNNTEAVDTPSSDHVARPSSQGSSANHASTSRPTYPGLPNPFFLADDFPSEYDSEEHSPIYRHSITHLPNPTYLPTSYFSSQHQDRQRQQQQQRTPYRLPPIPPLLPATTFNLTLQSSHTPNSPHNNSPTRHLRAAPPSLPLPPISSRQPSSSFIPLHLSIHTPLDPSSLSSNATYQLTPTKTFNLLHECNTLKKAEGVLSKHFANELRNLGFGGAVRVLGWRALVPPKTDGEEDGKGEGVGVGKKVETGKGRRVLRKREGNHEEGETPGVWWNVVSEAGWGEWVGRVQESAADAADNATLGVDGLGAVEGGVIESAGEGERAEGGTYPPEQGGEEFVVEAKAVVMMVVSKEARVKEPKKLATVGQVQHGQDRGGEYGAVQAGEGRGMKRRRLSMHGGYASPDGYSHGNGEMDDNVAWEEAIDDKDDGFEDVEAKEEQVSTVMIYRHEYDELVREGTEVRGLKAEVERLGKEIARLSMSLR